MYSRVSRAVSGPDRAPEPDPLLDLAQLREVELRCQLRLTSENDLQQLLATGSRSWTAAGSARASPAEGAAPRR